MACGSASLHRCFLDLTVEDSRHLTAFIAPFFANFECIHSFLCRGLGLRVFRQLCECLRFSLCVQPTVGFAQGCSCQHLHLFVHDGLPFPHQRVALFEVGERRFAQSRRFFLWRLHLAVQLLDQFLLLRSLTLVDARVFFLLSFVLLYLATQFPDLLARRFRAFRDDGLLSFLSPLAFPFTFHLLLLVLNVMRILLHGLIVLSYVMLAFLLVVRWRVKGASQDLLGRPSNPSQCLLSFAVLPLHLFQRKDELGRQEFACNVPDVLFATVPVDCGSRFIELRLRLRIFRMLG